MIFLYLIHTTKIHRRQTHTQTHKVQTKALRLSEILYTCIFYPLLHMCDIMLGRGLYL